MNTYTITEAKAKLPEIVRSSTTADAFIFRHGHPAAVVVGVERLEALYEEIEDLKDRLSVYEAQSEGADVRISLDKLKAELGVH